MSRNLTVQEIKTIRINLQSIFFTLGTVWNEKQELSDELQEMHNRCTKLYDLLEKQVGYKESFKKGN